MVVSDLGEYVSVRGDELRTFCTALTGDAEEAGALAARAASAAGSRAVRRGDVGEDVAVWRAAVHEYVASRRDRKQARVRAVRVLRELEDLGPRDIAPLVGRRPRWVARQLARAPLRRPDGLEAVTPGRRGRWVALGAALALVVASGAAGVLQGRGNGPAPPESGAAPTAEGLLPWPARGPLGHDRAFHAEAATVWQAYDHQVGRTYVLWAGRASGGRLAVLQAQVGVERLVALVADGDRGLQLVRVSGVPDERGALVIEYGGPQPTEPGVDGTPLRTLRLLVAPGTVSAQRRGVALTGGEQPLSVLGRPVRGVLADWQGVDLHDGLTAAWLDPAPSPALTAVRLGEGAVFLVGETHGFELLPFTLAPWSGEPVREVRGFPPAAAAEASLVLSQFLRTTGLETKPLDAGSIDGGDIYAVRRDPASTGCVGCTELYAITHNDTAAPATTSIQWVDAIVSPAGTVVIQATNFSTYWLLAPPGAARCVFGTRTPPAPTTPERDPAVIGAGDYDGSYVCIDERGKVIDRSGRNTGFRAAG